MLLVRSRSYLCAIPMEHIVETMRPLPVEPIDGIPKFVLGLSIIRGLPLPVIDLGALVGGGAGDSSDRVVTVRVADRKVALAVEGVIGLVRLDVARLQSLPPLLKEASADVINAIGTLDSQLLIVLNTGRIVPQELWQAIESGE